jgi:hypothetical protein
MSPPDARGEAPLRAPLPLIDTAAKQYDAEEHTPLGTSGARVLEDDGRRASIEAGLAAADELVAVLGPAHRLDTWEMARYLRRAGHFDGMDQDDVALEVEWHVTVNSDPNEVQSFTMAYGARRPFGLLHVGQIASTVDAAPSPGWLWRRMWPGDAYGVLSAGWKVGKTWMMLDAAVSVASGSPWLGTFPTDRTGRVFVFLGEGGARKMTRRGRAVAAHYGHRWDDLPIDMAERVPTLTNDEHVAALAAELEDARPVLVIIDPLYLAAGGADHKSLYGMGEVLRPAQVACQDVGAALLVAHHHNRDRSGKGSERMSGAGPAEWGRVLVSVERKGENVDTDTGRSDVSLELSFEGDEITGGTHRIRRQVWADDPDDLTSPMHYEVAEAHTLDEDDDPAIAGLSPSAKRVCAALEELGDWRTVREIGDHVAEDETNRGGLKVRTIQKACATLVAAGLVEVHHDREGLPGSWRKATPGGES